MKDYKELERNAEEARKRTEEHIAKMRKIRAEIRKITLSSSDTIKFLTGLIAYEEFMKKQKQLTEWIE